LAYFWTLKMEVICSSETSVDFQRSTRRYIPRDRTLGNTVSQGVQFVCHVEMHLRVKWTKNCTPVFIRVSCEKLKDSEEWTALSVE
jgi:hypothetical protein